MTTLAILLTRVLVVLTTSSFGCSHLLDPLRRGKPSAERTGCVTPAPRGHSQDMTNPLLTSALHRVPGLRRLPAAKLLAIGQVVMLAREHIANLEPSERRRFLELMRHARGRPGNLSSSERAELAMLIAKANPRRFIGLAADKLSPVPLPRRVVNGPRSKR